MAGRVIRAERDSGREGEAVGLSAYGSESWRELDSGESVEGERATSIAGRAEVGREARADVSFDMVLEKVAGRALVDGETAPLPGLREDFFLAGGMARRRAIPRQRTAKEKIPEKRERRLVRRVMRFCRRTRNFRILSLFIDEDGKLLKNGCQPIVGEGGLQRLFSNP